MSDAPQPEPQPAEPEPEPEAPEDDDADVTTRLVDQDTAEFHVDELLKTRADELASEGLSERFDNPSTDWPRGRDLDYEPAGHMPDHTPGPLEARES